MILPRTIDIAGFTYTIELNTDGLDERGTCIVGDTDHHKRKIRIRPNLTTQELVNTFFHEVLHCINNLYLYEELKEETVDVLSNGLHQVLKQLGAEFQYEE